MIKNIIFDLGKVLVDYDFSHFFAKFGISQSDKKFIEMAPLYNTFNCGEISREQFLLRLKEFLGTELDCTQIEQEWADQFTLIPEMVDLALSLKDNYQIYIFSNTDEIHFNHIIDKFIELKIFDNNYMLSYELGCIKPNEVAYEKALSKFDLNGEDSVFIDDRIENVIGAKIFGMHSIQHLDHLTTYKKLASILEKN